VAGESKSQREEAFHSALIACLRGESDGRARFIQQLRVRAIYMENLACMPPELGASRRDIRRWAEEVYAALNRLEIEFAPDPAEYPQDFTAQQYIDQMYHFANRLAQQAAKTASESDRPEPESKPSLEPGSESVLESKEAKPSDSERYSQMATQIGDETICAGIPPQFRTRPLGVEEAAVLMGYKSRRPARSLRSAMKRGKFPFEELTRQSYVFDVRKFPPTAQASVAEGSG
jgi:hypothetical protein